MNGSIGCKGLSRLIGALMETNTGQNQFNERFKGGSSRAIYEEMNFKL